VVFHYNAINPQRLDKYLVACLPEFSRNRLQTLIHEGAIQVNGAPARKTGQMLETGHIIQVSIPAVKPTGLVAEAAPLDIIFENEDVIVVNKAAGMVVHPAAGHHRGTLVHAALAHAPEMMGIGGEKRPGVVHRLDKDTSGLILLAKNDTAHRWLQEQFRARKVRKMYLALVDGRPPTPVGRIEAAIGRSKQEYKRMAVVVPLKGKEAVSEYRTLETFPEHTYLEVHPITGRTHQIRLHLKFLGCPVAGDRVYGRKRSTLPLERHFLHAARLTIQLPGAVDARLFEAPLPEDLTDILESLRRQS
jgi:23S rRNA pseudouridine1911/1915/1917 synthase